MTLYRFFFEETSGFIFACLCLAALLGIALWQVGRCEKLQQRNELLDKQLLYRRLREDKLARIADGVAEWDSVGENDPSTAVRRESERVYE